MISKKKAPSIKSLDPSMQRVINTVYDDINKIIDSVNNYVLETRKESDGKEGDIRILDDKVNDVYKIQAKTKDGWASTNLQLEERSD